MGTDHEKIETLKTKHLIEEAEEYLNNYPSHTPTDRSIIWLTNEQEKHFKEALGLDDEKSASNPDGLNS